MLKTTPILATALLLAACATPPSNNVKEILDRRHTERPAVSGQVLGAETVAQLRFSEGSSRLSNDSRRSLADALSRAKARGELEEVKVISWADQEFPSVQGKKLSPRQQNLARERNEAIEAVVRQETNGVDVDSFNMAERPNALERLFRTEDYRVKRSLEEAGIPHANSAVKAPPMEGKALVMFVVKDRTTSN